MDLDAIRALLNDLPGPDRAGAEAAAARQAQLTKPAGSLGRLEDIAVWAAGWQGRHPPRAERIQVVVFAANHGVTARGVSAYPPEVTAQMVANFAHGGAAINQLSRVAGAELEVHELALDEPTLDFTENAAMSEKDCADAIRLGIDKVDGNADLLCIGEMGIGNTTAAAALCCALHGGDAADWIGRGTGIDDAGLARKQEAVTAGVALHSKALADPLQALRRLGGRELAAIAGAVIGARQNRVPVMLDGYVCCAGAAPLHALNPAALDHCIAAHRSVEPGHDRLLKKVGLEPLLDLGMRLGEASGAALAANLFRAAVETHAGMATFADAGVSEKSD